MDIKAAIFGWNGVLIDSPATAIVEYCAARLGTTPAILTPALNRHLPSFQDGSVDERQFWSNVLLAGRICGTIPSGSLCSEAFRVSYEERPTMFGLVQTLHNNGYSTALLSNTEPPAVDFWKERNYPGFDQLIFSCEAGLVKPQSVIYELALERLGIEAGEAAFVDDKVLCVRGAERVGIKGIVYSSEEQVRRDLIEVGINIS